MDNVKWGYFQYRKNIGYPVYLRFKQEELHPKFVHLVLEMGFQELTEAESKKIPINRPHTRILTIQCASARLQQQINGSDLLDKYGQESLSIQAGTPVYTYRKVAMMAIPSSRTLWDLAINHDMSQTDQMVGMRIVLVRYISQAMAMQGVLAYWGTVKDENVIIMKQQQSFGEAVLIDFNKKLIFSNGGETRLGSSLKIIRKDKEVNSSHPIGQEELISFLCVSTCLLTFNGITPSMRKAIYDLSAQATASYGISDNSLNA
jgi:hypothetical protein